MKKKNTFMSDTAVCEYSILTPQSETGKGAVIEVNISYKEEQSGMNVSEPVACAGNNILRA